MLNSENAKQRKSLRATNIELQRRDDSISKYDDNKIYVRDYDNLYPLRIERVINNSSTAKRCVNLMSKYISGNGVNNNYIINSKGETINDLINAAASDLAYQYGVFFHISFKLDVENSTNNLKFKKSGLKILDYPSIARSKEDDDGFSGKFYLLKWNDEMEYFEKTDDTTTWYYPFNQNQNVIIAQMHNDCKILGIENPTVQDLVKNYRGQVYYLNMTPKYPYSLPLADSVYNDMDSESRITTYINTNVRKGWIGKTILVKYEDDEIEDSERPNKDRSVKTFENTIKDNLGAENSSNVLVISVPQSVEDVSKAFTVMQVKAQFDDKLFDTTTKNIRKNIIGTFNNIPDVLVEAGNGALFGTNSELYIQAKKFYWEQNEKERSKLESVFSLLLDTSISFIPINGVE